MTALGSMLGWSGAHVSRRLVRSIPLLGAVVVIATLGVAMRRKGVVGGLVDAGLNAVPVLGAVKNVAEVVRGRDFVPDRPPPRRPARRKPRRARA
jgi:hypothetical protein